MPASQGGSSPRPSILPGSVGIQHNRKIIKLKGVVCHPQNPAGIRKPPGKVRWPSRVRQFYGSGLFKQTGRHKTQRPDGLNIQNLFLGRGKISFPFSRVFKRKGKFSCRFPQQADHLSNRLVPKQGHLSKVYQAMGDAANRGILCASKKNRQVEIPWAVDAFSITWDWSLAYAFPPAPLIPRVLRKIREDQARIILIAPFWPKRAWFSLLRSLSESDPWVLPELRDLLHQGPVLHSQINYLHLTAWILNGRSLGERGFQTP